MHGNESLHAYLITFCVALASLCAWQAQRSRRIGWLVAACMACVVATFSFGPGIASFGAVLLLCLVLRVPWRWLTLPIGIALAVLVAYLFILPGDEGVRGVLDLRPIENAVFIARWLSAPWVNAWLGTAAPAASWLPNDAMLAATANAVVSPLGGDWRALSTALGLIGAGVFAVRFLFALLRPEQVTRLDVVALGLCTFALATATIIGVARSSYFRQFPDQTYADRYLLWPSLFWSGLAVLLLADVARRRSIVLRIAAFVLLFLLPVVLYVTQNSEAVWASVVDRAAQRNAAALRSGVFDAEAFAGGGPELREVNLRTLDLLREQHLAMFADPFWQGVGQRRLDAGATDPKYIVHASALQPLVDGRTGRPAAHFEGWVESGIRPLQRHGGQLAVLDEDGTIVGVGEFSYIAPNAQALRLTLPRKRGFDGYVRDFDVRKKYRLTIVHQNQATLLAPLSVPE